jgi:hypothetical protein
MRQVHPAIRWANETVYAAMFHAARANAAEAFMLTAEWDPDEPVPLITTLSGDLEPPPDDQPVAVWERAS